MRAASANVPNSQIHDNAGSGVFAQRNSTVDVLSESMISGNGSIGLELQSGSQGQIAGNTVPHNGATDIMLESGSNASIYNNTITTNGANPSAPWKMGVMVASADAEFVHHTISRNPGTAFGPSVRELIGRAAPSRQMADRVSTGRSRGP